MNVRCKWHTTFIVQIKPRYGCSYQPFIFNYLQERLCCDASHT